MAKKRKLKICLYCNEKIVGVNNKFCSHDCQKLHTEKDRNNLCLYCNERILSRNKKFCSHDCHKSYTKDNDTTIKEINCLVCNKVLSGRQTKYCSYRCSNKTRMDVIHLRRKLGTGIVHQERICYCGNSFYDEKKSTRFCSYACGKNKYRIISFSEMDDNNAYLLGYLYNSAYIYNYNLLYVHGTLEVVEKIKLLSGSTYPIFTNGIESTQRISTLKFIDNSFRYGLGRDWIYYDIPNIPVGYYGYFLDGLYDSGDREYDHEFMYIRLVNRSLCRFYSDIRGIDYIYRNGGWNLVIPL